MYNSHKNLHTDVHSSILHNSQKVHQLTRDAQTVTQPHVLHAPTRVTLENVKQSERGQTQAYSAQSSQTTDGEWLSGCWGRGCRDWGQTANRSGVSFGGDRLWN